MKPVFLLGQTIINGGLLCSNLKNPDTFNFNRNIESQNLIRPSQHSNWDYSDDEIDRFSNNSRINRSKIILKSESHYNPMNENEYPNRDWIIITANPQLIKHAPFVHTKSLQFSMKIIFRPHSILTQIIHSITKIILIGPILLTIS